MQRTSALLLATVLSAAAFAQGRPDLIADATDTRTTVQRTDVDPTAGISGPEAEAVRLHVYPDPACDRVVINAGGALLRDVRVFDLDAREVIARRGLGIPAEIVEVGDLPSGVYLVRVKTDSGVGVSRLVIQ